MTQTKIGKPDSEIIPVATELIRKAFNTLPGMEGREVIITYEGQRRINPHRGARVFWIFGQGEAIGECLIYWGQWDRLRDGKGIQIRPEQFELNNKQKRIA